MSYKIYFLVQTSVSTSTGPLPGVYISIAGGSWTTAPGVTGSDGKAEGTVDGESSASFTASRTGYKSQTMTGSKANTSSNPLSFLLQGQGVCFIVSAATGSRHSTEVRQMQEIRARVAALSGLTGQLIDGILREYYRFSPEIAANLEHDDAARGAVLSLVVRPLMAWFNLAVTLGLNPSDAKTIEQNVRDVLDQRQGAHGRLSGARILEAIRAGKPLPGLVPPAIRPFAEKAREAARLPLASWALLEPLARIWSLDTAHAHVIDEVSHWLAAAPLETLARPGGADDLDRELTTLAGFFDFCPLARRQVGIRLAAAWPEAVPALEKHGFVG